MQDEAEQLLFLPYAIAKGRLKQIGLLIGL